MLKRNILAAVLFTATGVVSHAALAGELPNGPHIVTSGSASIDVMPDMAVLSIEVNTTAKDAAMAKKLADARVEQYLTFLQKNNVQRRDINTANLRTQPDYDYQNGKTTLKGYRAIRDVRVTVRQLDNLNELLDGALKAGLNEIRALTPEVTKPEQYQEQVRKAAVANAVLKATQLVHEFNSTLGPVYSIRYHVADDATTPIMRAMRVQDNMAVAKVNSYEISPVQFKDRVDVVFEISAQQRKQAN